MVAVYTWGPGTFIWFGVAITRQLFCRALAFALNQIKSNRTTC